MEIFNLLSVSLLLLSCYTPSVYTQADEGCSASCGNCQLNNVQSLRTLVQNVVNQTLADTVEDIQQQLNDSIDEKIAFSQRDIPGNLKDLVFYYCTASTVKIYLYAHLILFLIGSLHH